jgi:hypothetical protein
MSIFFQHPLGKCTKRFLETQTTLKGYLNGDKNIACMNGAQCGNQVLRDVGK